MSRFLCISTPVRILDDGKPLHLPSAITVTELFKPPPHLIYEIRGRSRSLLCPRAWIQAVAIELIPKLLCLHREFFDPQLRNWPAILVSEETEFGDTFCAIPLLSAVTQPIGFIPIWNP